MRERREGDERNARNKRWCVGGGVKRGRREREIIEFKKK
jgi:hypothetical protein